MQKGICSRKKIFYGQISLTEKGQIAIPSEIRKDLGLKNGDKLLVIKRKDCKGINLVKSNEIDNFLNKLSDN